MALEDSHALDRFLPFCHGPPMMSRDRFSFFFFKKKIFYLIFYSELYRLPLAIIHQEQLSDVSLVVTAQAADEVKTRGWAPTHFHGYSASVTVST